MLLKKTGPFFLGLKTGYINNNTDSARVIKNLSAFNEAKKAKLQLFSLKPIVSLDQILFAAEQAASALEDKTAFSKRLEIELLLRLSAQRQISKALGLLATKGKKGEAVCLAAIGKDKDAVKKALSYAEKIIKIKEDSKAIEKNRTKNLAFIKKSFGITGAELAALSDLGNKAIESAVLERVALLSLET